MENEYTYRPKRETESSAEIPADFPLVCVIGHIASGKDETMAILHQNFGMYFISASQSIVEYASLHGIKPQKREDWWKIVQEMRSHFGKDILGKMAMDKVKDSYTRQIKKGSLKVNGFSMNGFRLFEDVQFLKANSHMFFIGLETDTDLRFERLLRRNRPGDVFNRRDFEERELEEGVGIDKILSEVDVVVQNEGTLEELEENIITIVKNRYPVLA